MLGIDHDIAIENAWQLNARWARPGAGGETPFHAHRLLEGPHRTSVLIADAGGGKSTVLRRIAFDAVGRDVLVVRARAKALAALADDEPTFAVALRRFIADHSGVTFSEASQLEAELQILLLDGLDEIGARAEALASHCAAYAASREHTSIVMAARPSHRSAATAMFEPATLLPLMDYERRSAVAELLRSIGEPEESARQSASRLEEVLEKTSFESLPLHVTMALHLTRSVQHERISLATLYARVLTSLWSRPLPDRTVPHVESVFVAQVLEATAWHLASQDGSIASDVVRAVAKTVGDGSGLAQEARVDQALLFWEGRAVLRRERVGGNDRFEFVHDSLRDFVAAQHLVRLPSDERRAWISKTIHSTIVRFAVALMGEAILQDVFAADPPTSADALIRCARATTEMEDPPTRFAVEVATNAMPFLASNIPSTVARFVATILPLVPAAREAFGVAADAAMSAGETWNVLAAWLVRVHRGVSIVEADALLEFVVSGAQLDGPRTGISEEWDLWNKLLEPALDALVQTKKSAALDELIEMLVLGEARLSAGALDKILARLSGWGYSDLLVRYRQSGRTDTEWFSHAMQRSLAADRDFLVLVSATFDAPDGRKLNTELPNLSALLQAFDFLEAAAADWQAVFFTKGANVMSVLLRGAARAAGCDEAMLAAEARHALAAFDTDRDDHFSTGLRKLGSGSPRELDWEATSTIGLSIEHVLAALRWPAAYARVALLLAAHHPDQSSVRRRIARMLEQGASYVVQVAEHLSAVLGADLADVVAGALAMPTDATAPLLVTLAKLEPHSSRTFEYVTSALESPSGVLVNEAAKAAVELPSTAALLSVLRDQLERWREWAAGQGPLEKREHGLVEPGTTLYAKHVAENLVRALAMHNALSYDDLVSFARDGAGATEALEAIVGVAKRDPTSLERAFDDIASGSVSARLAEKLLQVNGMPPAAASRLLSYHEHANASVRRAIVAGLRDCPWVARDEARRIWTACLADSDVHVRNEAQRALDGRLRKGPLRRLGS